MGGGHDGTGYSSVHGAAEELGSGDGVTINIRCSNGLKFSVQINLESTVDIFKSVLAQKCDIPAVQQRLIYKGRILKDDQILASYGLESDHIVHLVRGFATSSANSNGSPSPSPATNHTQNSTSTTSSDHGGTLGGSGLGASSLSGLDDLGDGSDLFETVLPDMEQVQQQLTRNPNTMREMMNIPIVQNLMNNPEAMQSIITNNPQMRQIMDRNPEIAHVLNDPSILRQTMEAARNPELVLEMTRNTDRAMSNIEASPGGFNMLRRMYENVQEPLLNEFLGSQLRDGSAGSTTPPSDNTSNPPAPNTNPLPNPWASSTATGRSPMNTSRSNNVREAGLSEFGNMFGSLSDPNILSQLMQYPAMNQMMQIILSNPQQLRGMPDSIPPLRVLLLNPNFMQLMTSPDTVQQLLTFRQSMLSQLGQQQTTGDTRQVGGASGTPGRVGNNALEVLMNMFGGLGSGGGGLAVPPVPSVPSEEGYAMQLSQLREMGFVDTQENMRALMATAGNVNAAIDRLLGNPPGQ